MVARAGALQGEYGNEAAVVVDVENNGVVPRPGMRLWLRPDKLQAGAVSEWRDMSGNDNHATALPGREPVAIANRLGDYATVHFDGSQGRHLQLGGVMAHATEGEVIVVVKSDIRETSDETHPLWNWAVAPGGYPNLWGVSDDFGCGISTFFLPRSANIANWNIYNVSSGRGTWRAHEWGR